MYTIQVHIVPHCLESQNLSSLAFVGSYADCLKANQLTRHFKLYLENHNNPSDKGAHSPMIMRQIPTKASTADHKRNEHGIKE